MLREGISDVRDWEREEVFYHLTAQNMLSWTGSFDATEMQHLKLTSGLRHHELNFNQIRQAIHTH